MLEATTTDEGLIRLVKDWREDEGWREFHRKYAPAIHAHAICSGLTHEQAEDVVQATMIKVATYLPKFEYDRTVCRFRTWLNQIVNQRIMAIWHDQKRLRLTEEVWIYLREFVGGSANPTADPVAQLEMEHRMLEVCMARVRAKAKPLQWQMFEANTVQGLDAKTVARKYGTTSANVWVTRHRLMNHLKEEWQTLLNQPFV